MIGLTFLTCVLVAPIVILTGFFAVEICLGLRPLRAPDCGELPAVAVVIVIPAHDEEAVIERTVRETIGEASAGRNVLVIADNCTDRTAKLARAAGAEVVERHDLEHRGKGFALAAAREHLRGRRVDVVVILDADCRLEAKGLDALLACAARTGRPCQAVNLLAPDLGAGPLVQISSFAFMVKNLIRQRALQRLAGRAYLTGTGMALPWAIFDGANLGGSNIVEDLALGLELAKRGMPPLLVENATVWSPPASSGGTLVQRRRWEGGFLATMLKTAPMALLGSVRRADARGFLAAIDLCIPPLALLAMLNVAAFLLALLAWAAGGDRWPIAVLVTVGVLAGAAVGLAWLREGRRFASAGTLLRLPFYVLWKLPMYVGLARKGAPKDWLRTGR